MNGFNLADCAVFAIIVIFSIWGCKKGLIKSVFSLGTIVISICLALALYQPVANVVSNSAVGEYVEGYVDKMLIEKENSDYAEQEQSENLALPDSFINSLTLGINSAKENTMEALSGGISSFIINIISMIIVFVLVKIITWIIGVILNSISKLPVLNGINRLLGGGFGILSGLLCVYILLAVLTIFAVSNPQSPVIESILNSSFASKMYNDNFIVNFLNIK